MIMRGLHVLCLCVELVFASNDFSAHLPNLFLRGRLANEEVPSSQSRRLSPPTLMDSLDCNFETDMCKFRSTVFQDNFVGAPIARWNRDSGGLGTFPWITPQPGPKPAVDHTTGTANGYYCHSEFYSEFYNHNDSSFMLWLDVGEPFIYDKISFWYSFGADENILEFQSSKDGFTYSSLLSKRGHRTSSSTQWLYAEVVVTDQAQYFRFKSNPISGMKTDIAIDDFKAHPYSPSLPPTSKPSLVPSVSPSSPPTTMIPYPIPTISPQPTTSFVSVAFMVGAAVTLFLLACCFFIASWSRMNKADRAKMRLKSCVGVRY
jgi:hypothetical protein